MNDVTPEELNREYRDLLAQTTEDLARARIKLRRAEELNEALTSQLSTAELSPLGSPAEV